MQQMETWNHKSKQNKNVQSLSKQLSEEVISMYIVEGP